MRPKETFCYKTQSPFKGIRYVGPNTINNIYMMILDRRWNHMNVSKSFNSKAELTKHRSQHRSHSVQCIQHDTFNLAMLDKCWSSCWITLNRPNVHDAIAHICFLGQTVFSWTVFHCIILYPHWPVSVRLNLFFANIVLLPFFCFFFLFLWSNFRKPGNWRHHLREMKFFLLFTSFGVVLSAECEYLINWFRRYKTLTTTTYNHNICSLQFAAIDYIDSSIIKKVSYRVPI